MITIMYRVWENGKLVGKTDKLLEALRVLRRGMKITMNIDGRTILRIERTKSGRLTKTYL